MNLRRDVSFSRILPSCSMNYCEAREKTRKISIFFLKLASSLECAKNDQFMKKIHAIKCCRLF